MRDLHERADAFTMLFTDGLGDPDEDAEHLRIALAALANEAVTRTTQAYSAGRGESAETEEYLAYARSLGPDLATLPRARALRAAQRLGRQRAPFSPYLFLNALAHRASLVLGSRRWRTTGL